ncbi:MAG: hypothetical protein WC813_03405 [Patescibacteria group bacterium]|jgi:ppGpp synthetase/RelA/SpoT-type nucleotidyltranferase
MKAEDKIREEYVVWAPVYLKLQRNILRFVNQICEECEEAGIDVETIGARKNIKDIGKILENYNDGNKNSGKKKYKSLFSFKDIAGVRVTLNCADDLWKFADRLDNELKAYRLEGKCVKTSKDEHGVFDTKTPMRNQPPLGLTNNKTDTATLDRRSSPFYDAIHFTVTKTMRYDRIARDLHCEIQLRTVLGDAWAVQDRKYLYGRDEKGDSKDLSDAISLIHRGCEKVWQLVQKQAREQDDKKNGL